jgi:Zn-dependent oligopeptidase
MRLDVFQAKISAEKNMKASGDWEKVSPEAKRLVEKSILDGKRAGLGLAENERMELMDRKKELSQVCLEFSKNYNEEKVLLSFTMTFAHLSEVFPGSGHFYTQRT